MSHTLPTEASYRWAGLMDDRRLAEVEANLRAEGAAVLSLDCFDTLLWRKVPKPTDAFLVLGERLAASGYLVGGVTPRSFAQLRVIAEQTARHRRQAERGTSEINLGHIYAELPAISDLDPARLMRVEVEVEKDLTVADPLLAEALASLVDQIGLRVIVVSDMYLTAADIGYLLDRPEMSGLRIETIITSNETGVGKEHGLWSILPAQLGVAPGDIVHIGNNRRADYSAPLEAGVRAIHYAEVPERIVTVLANEGSVGPAGTISRWCDSRQGDGGLTAIRGRAAYAATSLRHSDQVAWETGACVLGPVLSDYGDWVHERTSQLGIGRALCLMREGRLLREVIDAAPAVGGAALSTSLLWASREAVARASFLECNAEELQGFFARPRPPRLAAAARTLGLELAAFPRFAQLAEEWPHLAASPELLREFLSAVLGDQEAVEQVRAVSARRRRNLLAHLRRALGGATGDVALVDIGWAGTMQAQLQSLADAGGLGVRFHGLYLMADLCPPQRVLAGHRIEGYLSRPGDPAGEDIGRLVRNRYILELFLSSSEGTTLEIDDDGTPVCSGSRPDARQEAQRDAVQDGIRAFQQHLNAYRQLLGCRRLLSPAVREAWGRRIVERFVCEPTVAEALTFANWEWEDDHGNVETVTLVPPGADAILRRYSGDKLAELPFERVVWPAGADAVWSDGRGPLPADLASAGMLRLQLLGPTAAPIDAMSLWRLGRDGSSTASWSGPGSGVQVVRLRPAATAALARLDMIRVHVQNQTGWRRPVWTWTAGDDPGRIGVEQCEWVTANIINLSTEAVLVLELDAPLPAMSEVMIEVSAGFLNFNEGGFRLSATPAGPQLVFAAP